MNAELKEFLTRNDACIEVLARLAATGAASRASADVSDASVYAAARDAQAKWIRENIKLSDLHIN